MSCLVSTKQPILAEFEGRKVIDGKKRLYWIQILTEDYIEEATGYMCGDFLRDEPLCRYASTLDLFEFISSYQISVLFVDRFKRMRAICEGNETSLSHFYAATFGSALFNERIGWETANCWIKCYTQIKKRRPCIYGMLSIDNSHLFTTNNVLF